MSLEIKNHTSSKRVKVIKLLEQELDKLIFPFKKHSITSLEYKPFSRFSLAKSLDEVFLDKLSSELISILNDRNSGTIIVEPEIKNKKFDKEFLVKLSTGLAYLVGNPNFDSMTGKYYARFYVKHQDSSDSYLRKAYAPSSLTSKEIDTNLIKQSKIFLTQLEIPIEVTLHCLKAAKEHGLINILNPAPACKLSNDFFKLVDYFTPNETEAEFFTGIKIHNENDAKVSAKKLIEMGIKKVIITLGEKGLFYSDGNEEIYMKATPDIAVDTTGAGDAFNGGLAFSLFKERPIRECLELANKVAGISTTKLGAGDAMPYISDIK